MSKTNWQKKEKNDAKDFDGKQTKRSGGNWWDKGDVKTGRFLIDCKTSKAERFSITAKMWKKLDREALVSRKLPILSVEFGREEIDLVIISKDDFINFVNK